MLFVSNGITVMVFPFVWTVQEETLALYSPCFSHHSHQSGKCLTKTSSGWIKLKTIPSLGTVSIRLRINNKQAINFDPHLHILQSYSFQTANKNPTETEFERLESYNFRSKTTFRHAVENLVQTFCKIISCQKLKKGDNETTDESWALNKSWGTLDLAD